MNTRRKFLATTSVLTTSAVMSSSLLTQISLAQKPSNLLGDGDTRLRFKSLAWANATLLPVDKPPIENGTIVIRDGKITAIGKSESITIPGDAIVNDAKGKWIMPGLICTHSHIGGAGGADGSSPIQPGVRVMDSINVRDSGFRRALASAGKSARRS